jgi:hypothetical protein
MAKHNIDQQQEIADKENPATAKQNSAPYDISSEIRGLLKIIWEDIKKGASILGKYDHH